MKKLIFLLLVLFGWIASQGQYNPAMINKKASDQYRKALELAHDGQYRPAIKLLEGAVKTDSRFLDAYLSIAGIYGELKEYRNAIINYERARAIDSNYFRDYALPYSINLAGAGEFQTALSAVNDFLTIPDLNASGKKAGEYRKQCYQFAIDYAEKHDLSNYKFEPANLGDSINSNVSEYFPALTIEGDQLFYTRRVNNNNEDFYGAVKSGSVWGKGKSLTGDINTASNEGAQNISQDGEWLIFTGCNFSDGFGSCDLYISYLTQNGWSMPENLGEAINTEAWESAPSLSPDKRSLYFASNRSGGFGKSDIYVSHLQSNGKWTTPENAGPKINTAGNESCPFIHADNRTLYFTSDGHPGYGGDDLFVVKKSGNDWSVSQNLGYPINTVENEGSMVVAADGKTAYYASDRGDSRGGLDLYNFELRDSIRPAKTLWVKGKVFDAETPKGLPSAIELTDLSTQQTLSKVQTDQTGNYLITLPVGEDYAFNVTRKGYLFYSENFPLSQNAADSTYHIDIPLQPLKSDATVVLKNIFFDINSFELKQESIPELQNIAMLLKDNPSLKISIEGHTDNTGSPPDNLKLSKERAQAVIQHLIKDGVDAKRLSAKGFGETKPIANNNSEEGRTRNRRTEMKILNR